MAHSIDLVNKRRSYGLRGRCTDQQSAAEGTEGGPRTCAQLVLNKIIKAIQERMDGLLNTQSWGKRTPIGKNNEPLPKLHIYKK